MRKLFLDDLRIPKDAIGLVSSNLNQFYWANDWDIVRCYDEFVSYITKNGLPDFISFDHDLADEHYIGTDTNEKTGFECAKWLVDFCLDNDGQIPDFMVHSANPVGKKNIESYLANAQKHLF